MKRHYIPLGRILGIPVGLDYSWFLAFALFTWAFALSYYPAEFGNWSAAEYWITGALTASLFFASVLLHELGHSVIALRNKVSVRSITLFIFGGVAEIASEPPSAGVEFRIAIAGPIVSFALALVFRALGPLFAGSSQIFALTKYLAYLNASLAFFNLIPGFPLDGGRIFRAIVWAFSHNLQRATLVAAGLGRFIAFLFILLGVWQVLAGNLINGLWIAFIGWFLESAAVAQTHQQMLQHQLVGHTASEVMGYNYAAIPAQTTLDEVVHRYVLGHGLRSFIVESEHGVVGLLALDNIKAVPLSRWLNTTAAETMTPLGDLHFIRSDTELWTVLKEMDSKGVDQLPVIADAQVRGIVTRDGIIGYLRALHELGI